MVFLIHGQQNVAAVEQLDRIGAGPEIDHNHLALNLAEADFLSLVILKRDIEKADFLRGVDLALEIQNAHPLLGQCAEFLDKLGGGIELREMVIDRLELDRVDRLLEHGRLSVRHRLLENEHLRERLGMRSDEGSAGAVIADVDTHLFLISGRMLQAVREGGIGLLDLGDKVLLARELVNGLFALLLAGKSRQQQKGGG